MNLKHRFLFLLLVVLINCKTSHFENLGLVKPVKNISYLPPEFEKFDIFSYNLFELNEPKLFGLKDENIEIYRLTSVISFGGDNSVVTIIKNNLDNSIYKFIKVDSFKKRRILKKKIKISDLEFKNFTSNLNSFDIQNFPKNNFNNVDDGIQYLLEIYKNGKYSAFIRNNPQTGKNADAKFLGIIKLFYDLK
ncbi:MAG: hypothetical protein H7195_11720 [Chryseobacterium sp.]|nr:hypothetical protein [Chryseobacterium sp.]